MSEVRYQGQHTTTTPGPEIFVGTRKICQILSVVIVYMLFLYTREYSPSVFIFEFIDCHHQGSASSGNLGHGSVALLYILQRN